MQVLYHLQREPAATARSRNDRRTDTPLARSGVSDH